MDETRMKHGSIGKAYKAKASPSPPAAGGEGRGEEGCFCSDFPSPQPSPRSFLAGRGRRVTVAACLNSTPVVLNPKGIPPQSPGLRGTSYPGSSSNTHPQPQRGCDQFALAGPIVKS